MYVGLILFIIVGGVFGKDGGKTGSNIGPYRAILVSVAQCENTTYPVDQDRPVMMSLEVSTGVKYPKLMGNLTVLREARQVKLKVKSLVLENGKYRMTYIINNVSCNGLLQQLLSKAMRFDLFDTTKCAFLKGKFIFNDVDINAMQHLWATKWEYGQVIWRYELTSGLLTYYCWDITTLVERL